MDIFAILSRIGPLGSPNLFGDMIFVFLGVEIGGVGNFSFTIACIFPEKVFLAAILEWSPRDPLKVFRLGSNLQNDQSDAKNTCIKFRAFITKMHDFVHILRTINKIVIIPCPVSNFTKRPSEN